MCRGPAPDTSPTRSRQTPGCRQPGVCRECVGNVSGDGPRHIPDTFPTDSRRRQPGVCRMCRECVG
eukprot:8638267-Lingulodinium_polyedra.AAC.1